MGFRGEAFAFDSPGAAVVAMAAAVGRADVEACELRAARGRVIRVDVQADRDSPAFDYSAMDGFAVRVADLIGSMLPVVGESRIGMRPPELAEGAGAIRIATGAPIPHRADAVVRREDVHESPDGCTIEIPAAVAARLRVGESIRHRGENARAGEVVLPVGSVLSAAGVGTLAAVGAVRVEVSRRVRVSLISTGDELVEPEDAPAEYQIRNSSLPALEGVLSAHACIEVVRVVHVRDDESAVEAELRARIADSDAVVMTGGVSMGHRDPVRGAVDRAIGQRAGGRVLFHGLPQRPGKPMLGAITSDGKAVFGLPGNPLSSMVTCTRIVLPVLGAIAGVLHWPGPNIVRVVGDDGQTIGGWWHRLVRLNGRGEAELVGTRGSGDIIAGGRSDGVIEIAPGSEETAAGASGGDGCAPFYAWPR